MKVSLLLMETAISDVIFCENLIHKVMASD